MSTKTQARRGDSQLMRRKKKSAAALEREHRKWSATKKAMIQSLGKYAHAGPVPVADDL